MLGAQTTQMKLLIYFISFNKCLWNNEYRMVHYVNVDWRNQYYEAYSTDY